MAYSVHAVNDPTSKDDELTLELLDAIEQRCDVSQRHLAAKLGIALGLTNSYLKRCARKGLVKVKEVPANRYLYYLTPQGFAEKSRLTAKFLSTSLTFYRQSAEACTEVFQYCEENKLGKILLCGPSDLAEIAYTRSGAHRVRVVGVYERRACGPRELLGLDVYSRWGNLPEADAYMVTDLEDPLGLYRDLVARTSTPDRVLVPRVLGLDRAINNAD